MSDKRSALTRAVAMVLIGSLVLAGCGRTYVYGSQNMPKIVDGAIEVRSFKRSHAPIERYDIERIGIRQLADPQVLRQPTKPELDALLARTPLHVHSVEIDVDASAAHWRDYGLGGAGIGISLVTIANLSSEESPFADNQAGLVLGSVLMGGLGFLTGLMVGTMAGPSVVDLRADEASW